MSKELTRWTKANISYENYSNYIKKKSDGYKLSLIDLLYISNFKGGNASISEKESSVNKKLREYSSHLKTIKGRFENNRLIDLSKEELLDLKKLTSDFLNLTHDNSEFRIDGFKNSFASALLHFYFPELIPILDRRVLNGVGIEVETNSQKQVVHIYQYYPELIDLFYNELRRRKNITLRELDKEYFIKPIS